MDKMRAENLGKDGKSLRLKRIKCRLFGHRWGPWEEVGFHLERECLRCGKIQCKFPSASVMLVKLGCDLLHTYLKRRIDQADIKYRDKAGF